MSTPSQAARSGALVVVEPELGCLRVTGPDRKSWLNGIVSCDVLAVAPGTGAWGLALTKQGKIVSDVAIVADSEALYVSTAPGTAAELAASFDRMLVMEDAELENRSGQLVWVRVHGPKAAELAAGLEAPSGAIDWTRLGGAAIVAPRPRLDEIVGALQRGGAVVGSELDWERLRVERAVPRFGVDYDAKDNPHEASLDQRAVNWSKGCYLGQEVVCMQDMRGKVKRRIAALELELDAPPPRGTAVVSGADTVGEVTSSVASEVAGRPLALARLRVPFDQGGHELSVGDRPARIVDARG